MKAKDRLLINILCSNESHARPCDRLADGFCISCIVFVGFYIRLHELWGHQFDRMAHRLKLAGPVVGTPAGFHANQARLQICKIGRHLFSFQLLFLGQFAALINSVNLKNFFGKIKADCGNFHRGRSHSLGGLCITILAPRCR